MYLLLSIPPKISISSFMGYLKRKSALTMFDLHANLKYKFGNRQLCDQDVVERLLNNMSDELKKAYNHYQTLLQAVHQKDCKFLIKLSESAAGMPEPIITTRQTGGLL
ncbi:hypothetical protein FC89_GL001986 [Liquorilactobacillus ghanensis DSM 18630]|uniref:Uncharacterized protein n=1 Tax=Liquorilactobacillus ghanensis DSM 18630 TaxID=1423750 RepID=A0A0R1VPW2_9LACO|nr:hypothetical protein FC89_GL001986 [Liquorilactobacillus ghanensis DSM 18630]